MIGYDAQQDRAVLGEEGTAFHITPLSPDETGLPMMILAKRGRRSRPEPSDRRRRPSRKRPITHEVAVVTVSDAPQVVRGTLSPELLQALARWMPDKPQANLDRWNGVDDSLALCRRLGLSP